MTLEKKCGLKTPLLDVTSIETPILGKRHVFLIERFDRIKTEEGGCYPVPFISGLTGTGIHESDYAQWSYRAHCDAILKLSSHPKRDKIELFKRVIFNILVFNNDDHLRNHGFIYAGNNSWDLAPLYDVVPSTIHSETYFLSLRLGDEGKKASIRNAMSALDYFGISEPEAQSIVLNMKAKIAHWEAHFKKCGVSQADLEKIRNSFKNKDDESDYSL